MAVPGFTQPRRPPGTAQWYGRFLQHEAGQTANLWAFVQNARLELDDFIRHGNLTQSDDSFYEALKRETARVAAEINAEAERWAERDLPNAYEIAATTHAPLVVVPKRALEALAGDSLGLIRNTTDEIRRDVRQSIAAGILSGLSGGELRSRIASSGLGRGVWPSVEYRAGVIARTETMKAYNAGALEGVKANGAKFVRWIASPDEATCPTCGPRDNRVYRLYEEERPAAGQPHDYGDADTNEVMRLSERVTKAYNDTEQLRMETLKQRSDAGHPVHAEYTAALVGRMKMDAELGEQARAYRARTGKRLPRPASGPEAIAYDRFANLQDALRDLGHKSEWTGHVSIVDKYGPAASVTRAGNLYIAKGQILGRGKDKKLDIRDFVDADESETLPLLLHESMHASSPGFTTPKPGSITSGSKALEEGIAEQYARTLYPTVAKKLGLDADKWTEEQRAYDVETGLLERMREDVGKTPGEFYRELHRSSDRFALLTRWQNDARTDIDFEIARRQWQTYFSWN